MPNKMRVLQIRKGKTQPSGRTLALLISALWEPLCTFLDWILKLLWRTCLGLSHLTPEPRAYVYFLPVPRLISLWKVPCIDFLHHCQQNSCLGNVSSEPINIIVLTFLDLTLHLHPSESPALGPKLALSPLPFHRRFMAALVSPSQLPAPSLSTTKGRLMPGAILCGLG